MQFHFTGQALHSISCGKNLLRDGVLRYPNFLETVVQVIPMYKLRALGGSLYLLGSLVMVYNLIKTVRAGKMVANEEAEAPALEKIMLLMMTTGIAGLSADLFKCLLEVLL